MSNLTLNVHTADGSTNGTVVNHQRLNAPMILGARVPVRIGATTFELR